MDLVNVTCNLCSSKNLLTQGTCSTCDQPLHSESQRLGILVKRIEILQTRGELTSSDASQEVNDLRTVLAWVVQKVPSTSNSSSSTTQQQSRAPAPTPSPPRPPVPTPPPQQQPTPPLTPPPPPPPKIDASLFVSKSVFCTTQYYQLRRGTLNGEEVVCKQLNTSYQGNGANALKAQEKFKGSIQLGFKLNGGDDTIMSLIGVADFDTNNPKLYMKYMAHEDLGKKLATSSISKKNMNEIALQVSKALSIIHSMNLLHRTVCPSHVLLDENDSARLAGLSNIRELGDSMTMGVGEARYSAPEMMEEDHDGTNNYTEKADIYSFGLLLVVLDTQKIPFLHVVDRRNRSVNDGTLADFIRTGKVDPTVHPLETNDPWFVNLVKKCTNKDPNKRPSALEILNILQKNVFKFNSIEKISAASLVIDANVTVVKANNIANIQPFGVQEPYCAVSLGAESFNTQIVPGGGVFPVWNENFTFRDVDVMGGSLELSILKRTFILFKGMIGRSTLALYEAAGKDIHSLVVFRDGNGYGTLEIKVVLTGDVKGYLLSYINNSKRYLESLGGASSVEGDVMKKKLPHAERAFQRL